MTNNLRYNMMYKWFFIQTKEDYRQAFASRYNFYEDCAAEFERDADKYGLPFVVRKSIETGAERIYKLEDG